MAVLYTPMVLERIAWVPTAVLSNQIVMSVDWLSYSASKPKATLSVFQATPRWLKDWANSALHPTATFCPAVVLERSAVLPLPLLAESALTPLAVLPESSAWEKRAP